MPEFAPNRLRFHRRRAQRAGAAILFFAVALLTGAGIQPEQAQSAPAQQAPPPDPSQPDPQPEVKPAPPTPIAVKKVELGQDDPWDPAWDIMIEKALPRDLVSRRRAAAVQPLCPRYRKLKAADRRAFWAYFFQALAGAEAGLKPTADVRHTDPEVAVLDTVTHRIVRQEGLLQLTYMDSVRYGCNFDWQRDKDLPEHDPAKTILQPRNNLLCGIRILENQLVKQHKPLLTESSYWVTLRPEHPSFKIFLRQMANVPAACGAVLHKPAEEQPELPAADEAKQSAPHPAQPAAEAEPEDDPASTAGPAADPASKPAGASGPQ